jgi:hypothetical protein
VKLNEKNDSDIEAAQAHLTSMPDDEFAALLYGDSTPTYSPFVAALAGRQWQGTRYNGKIRWSAARKKKAARTARAGSLLPRSISPIEESIWDVLAEKWTGARTVARADNTIP